MSSLNNISLLTTSIFGSSSSNLFSDFLVFLGLPSLIWGAFICYFGFKIFKFIIAFNTACMCAAGGILLGILTKSSQVGVVASVLGFILGAYFGFKFYKFMVTVNFSFTVGAIVGVIAGIISESLWIGVFILLVVAVPTFMLVYKIYDIIMILYTALSGAFSIASGLMLMTQSITVAAISLIICTVTGFKYQSKALKKDPQYAQEFNQPTTTNDASENNGTPPLDPSKPMISPEAQAKIDALIEKIKPIVIMLLNKKIQLPTNSMYYFLGGSILSLISVLLAFDQGIKGITLTTNVLLSLTLCLIFGKYVSIKITDIMINGAMYGLIFFSGLRVMNFMIKNSHIFEYYASLWCLLFLYYVSIFVFGLVLWLNLSNTKKDDKHLAIVGAVISVLFICLWIKGYKVNTMTSISMVIPLVPYMNIPELILKAKTNLDKAQSEVQQNQSND